jgi:hypothetical protein
MPPPDAAARRQRSNEVTALAEQSRKKARGKPPIHRHPLFPAIVALWFGALFAVVGLLVAAPFGSAVRIGLLLAMTAIGGLLGTRVAHRLAGDGPANEPGPAAPDDAGESPLWSELKSRRRALAAEERPPEILDVAGVDGPSSDKPGERDAEPVPDEPGTDAPVAADSAADRIASADLDELSHVELLERLALSMQRRNHLIAAAMEARQLGAAAAADEAAPSAGSETAVVFPGEAERRVAIPAAPAKSAPAAPSQSAAETEQALRTALAALQKISGAA